MHRGSAIVLAAGGSRRMGRPKALLPWEGVPLVAAHVRALAGRVGRIVVVIGGHADAVRASIPAGVSVVENPEWATTAPSDSARLAAAGLEAPLLVTPVDVVPAEPELVARLLAAGRTAVPVGPDGRWGHPIALDAAALARLLGGQPLPEGLRSLLAGALELPVDRDVAADFDHPAAFRAVGGRGTETG
jgi:molybdenum cofactor cytidylyltransferase